MDKLTPVRTPNDRIITCCAGGSRIARDAEVSQFDGAIFGR
jgi:hypothetical protein